MIRVPQARMEANNTKSTAKADNTNVNINPETAILPNICVASKKKLHLFRPVFVGEATFGQVKYEMFFDVSLPQPHP